VTTMIKHYDIRHGRLLLEYKDLDQLLEESGYDVEDVITLLLNEGFIEFPEYLEGVINDEEDN